MDKDAVTVMTFNIRYDNPGDSAYSWSRRSPVISNFFLKEKPDIIGLQEVLYNQYSFLDSVLANYISVGVGRDDGARMGEGVVERRTLGVDARSVVGTKRLRRIPSLRRPLQYGRRLLPHRELGRGRLQTVRV